MTVMRMHSRARAGAAATTWIVAGGAAAIVACTALLVYKVVGGAGEHTDATVARMSAPMHFKCERCGHEFAMAPTEFHKQWKDVSQFKKEEAHKANCPKCGGRFCAPQTDDPHASRDGGQREDLDRREP